MTPTDAAAPAGPARSTPRRFAAGVAAAFRAYAAWLVGISWKRFIVLALLLLVAAGMLQELLHVLTRDPPARPAVTIDGDGAASDAKGRVRITIDEHGVRIRPQRPAAEASAPAASAPRPSIDIELPPGLSEQARRNIDEALAEAQQAVAEAIADDSGRDRGRPVVIKPARANEDWLIDLAALWIVASLIVKLAYAGRLRAEVKAAQAEQTAEAETLKRQVVEARLAAMQAQVEPHFLFNTLASIDHLIETDPPRASRMQKHLIALLRAAMPSLRDTQPGAARTLGRELDVIRPYLEILKVRMEDRLRTAIDVPDGLLSAEFPALMLQGLVENAIKHGLEPKAEGGELALRAQVVHGKLVLAVSDTGLGFGRAATAGTGVGLANIRERLALLYGAKGTLAITENAGGGTTATITVPYRSLDARDA
jgi:signal transduction histidine kinase